MKFCSSSVERNIVPNKVQFTDQWKFKEINMKKTALQKIYKNIEINHWLKKNVILYKYAIPVCNISPIDVVLKSLEQFF